MYITANFCVSSVLKMDKNQLLSFSLFMYTFQVTLQ